MRTEAGDPGAGSRPAVSVVVPFAGERAEAEALLAGLASLRLRDGDELIVVDNNPARLVDEAGEPGAPRVVHAPEQRSSYYARNRGAELAGNEWLLFTDADCVPAPTLLDDFFAPPPEPRLGALAGAVTAAPGTTLVERWAASRELLGQRAAARLPGGPAAVTANLLVRRAAWVAVGGFCEGVRSGGDLEFCWRLADAGWRLDWRPEATVRHRHRRALGGVIRQMRRYGAGNAWQNRRRPEASPSPRPLARLPRMVGASGVRAARGRFEEAAMAAVDGVALVANSVGRLEDNAVERPAPVAAGPRSLAVFVDRFPAVSETFVASEARALTKLGWRVRFEAAARPERPVLGGAREWRVDYLEDEGPATRAVALARVAARHPLRCLADVVGRRRWPPAERMPLRGLAPAVRRLQRAGDAHVHVHFAGPAATHGLRAALIAGVPASIAVHGYDVYGAPSGLAQKLAGAAFVAAPCDYVRRDLEALLEPGSRAKVERVVMGVDGERFARRSPPPGARTVVAIGRYVEKKGFGHLLEAAAILRRNGGAPIRVVIAGDGPLRGELERRARSLGLADSVTLPRADGFEAVRELLEGADLLAMPCVIAADGDRDSMPVVVKEALSMEVPVVASDEVGLPELVRAEWGRLVPPGDDAALAAAIAELLELPAAERAAMGSAGRDFVLEHCDLEREAERLAALIRASASGTGSPPAPR